MSIADNIKDIKDTLPANVKLVAVSKFHPIEAITEAYNTGHRVFGESKMQEIEQKHVALPKDIEWHFIGHLQTNKVKTIIPYINTIHSVDSTRLLNEIEKQAAAIEKTVNCLLEIHIAEEESKYGFSFEQCKTLIESDAFRNLKYARVVGIMGMATYTSDEKIIRSEFHRLNEHFNELKSHYFKENKYFSEISMGMSNDYLIAIDEGATMIRVGSSIFGQRT